jgi:hypothetical protein
MNLVSQQQFSITKNIGDSVLSITPYTNGNFNNNASYWFFSLVLKVSNVE